MTVLRHSFAKGPASRGERCALAWSGRLPLDLHLIQLTRAQNTRPPLGRKRTQRQGGAKGMSQIWTHEF